MARDNERRGLPRSVANDPEIEKAVLQAFGAHDFQKYHEFGNYYWVCVRCQACGRRNRTNRQESSPKHLTVYAGSNREKDSLDPHLCKPTGQKLNPKVANKIFLKWWEKRHHG